MKTREIKFRVWNERMYYFDKGNGFTLSFFSEGIPWGVYDSATEQRYVTGDPNAIFNTPGIIMQFTGLLDKNGKEIYEGDIVKCHDHPTGVHDTTGEVIFNQGRYWVSPGSICSLDDYGTAWTEVIGNIYKNSDLLK